MLLEIIGAILSMVGSWMIFKKMGRQGWEGIVPIYSTYVLCKVLYGNGWKFLLLLIPFYNIYFAIKMMVDLQPGRGLCHRSAAAALRVQPDPGLWRGSVYGRQLCQHPARHGGGRGQQGQGCRVRRPERPVNIKKLRPDRSFLTLDRIKRGEASASPLFMRFLTSRSTGSADPQRPCRVSPRPGPSRGRCRGWRPGCTSWPAWPARTYRR